MPDKFTYSATVDGFGKITFSANQPLDNQQIANFAADYVRQVRAKQAQYKSGLAREPGNQLFVSQAEKDLRNRKLALENEIRRKRSLGQDVTAGQSMLSAMTDELRQFNINPGRKATKTEWGRYEALSQLELEPQKFAGRIKSTGVNTVSLFGALGDARRQGTGYQDNVPGLQRVVESNPERGQFVQTATGEVSLSDAIASISQKTGLTPGDILQLFGNQKNAPDAIKKFREYYNKGVNAPLRAKSPNVQPGFLSPTRVASRLAGMTDRQIAEAEKDPVLANLAVSANLPTNVTSGAAGFVVGLTGLADMMNVPGADKVRRAAKEYAGSIGPSETPEDAPTLTKAINLVGQSGAVGLGSMLPTLIPGAAAGKLASAAGAVSPLAAEGVAAVTDAAIASLSNMGENFGNAVDAGVKRDVARSRAFSAGLADGITNTITNRLGLYGTGGGILRRTISSALSEGVEEVENTIAGNWVTQGKFSKDLLKGVGESFVLGALLGGGVSVAMSGEADAIDAKEPILADGTREALSRSKWVNNPVVQRVLTLDSQVREKIGPKPQEAFTSENVASDERVPNEVALVETLAGKLEQTVPALQDLPTITDRFEGPSGKVQFLSDIPEGVQVAPVAEDGSVAYDQSFNISDAEFNQYSRIAEQLPSSVADESIAALEQRAQEIGAQAEQGLLPKESADFQIEALTRKASQIVAQREAALEQFRQEDPQESAYRAELDQILGDIAPVLEQAQVLYNQEGSVPDVVREEILSKLTDSARLATTSGISQEQWVADLGPELGSTVSNLYDRAWNNAQLAPEIVSDAPVAQEAPQAAVTPGKLPWAVLGQATEARGKQAILKTLEDSFNSGQLYGGDEKAYRSAVEFVDAFPDAALQDLGLVLADSDGDSPIKGAYLGDRSVAVVMRNLNSVESTGPAYTVAHEVSHHLERLLSEPDRYQLYQQFAAEVSSGKFKAAERIKNYRNLPEAEQFAEWFADTIATRKLRDIQRKDQPFWNRVLSSIREFVNGVARWWYRKGKFDYAARVLRDLENGRLAPSVPIADIRYNIERDLSSIWPQLERASTLILRLASDPSFETWRSDLESKIGKGKLTETQIQNLYETAKKTIEEVPGSVALGQYKQDRLVEYGVPYDAGLDTTTLRTSTHSDESSLRSVFSGMADRAQQGSVGWQEEIDDARNSMASDKNYLTGLLARVKKSGRDLTLSASEQVALGLHVVELRSSYLKTSGEMAGLVDQIKVASGKTLAQLEARFRELEAQRGEFFDQIDMALDGLNRAGSTLGRALNARKIILDNTFDMPELFQKQAKAKKGRDLTAPEKDTIDKTSANIQKAKGQLEAAGAIKKIRERKKKLQGDRGKTEKVTKAETLLEVDSAIESIDQAKEGDVPDKAVDVLQAYRNELKRIGQAMFEAESVEDIRALRAEFVRVKRHLDKGKEYMETIWTGSLTPDEIRAKAEEAKNKEAADKAMWGVGEAGSDPWLTHLRKAYDALNEDLQTLAQEYRRRDKLAEMQAKIDSVKKALATNTFVVDPVKPREVKDPQLKALQDEYRQLIKEGRANLKAEQSAVDVLDAYEKEFNRIGLAMSKATDVNEILKLAAELDMVKRHLDKGTEYSEIIWAGTLVPDELKERAAKRKEKADRAMWGVGESVQAPWLSNLRNAYTVLEGALKDQAEEAKLLQKIQDLADVSPLITRLHAGDETAAAEREALRKQAMAGSEVAKRRYALLPKESGPDSSLERIKELKREISLARNSARLSGELLEVVDQLTDDGYLAERAKAEDPLPELKPLKEELRKQRQILNLKSRIEDVMYALDTGSLVAEPDVEKSAVDPQIKELQDQLREARRLARVFLSSIEPQNPVESLRIGLRGNAFTNFFARTVDFSANLAKLAVERNPLSMATDYALDQALFPALYAKDGSSIGGGLLDGFSVTRQLELASRTWSRKTWEEIKDILRYGDEVYAEGKFGQGALRLAASTDDPVRKQILQRVDNTINWINRTPATTDVPFRVAYRNGIMLDLVDAAVAHAQKNARAAGVEFDPAQARLDLIENKNGQLNEIIAAAEAEADIAVYANREGMLVGFTQAWSPVIWKNLYRRSGFNEKASDTLAQSTVLAIEVLVTRFPRIFGKIAGYSTDFAFGAAKAVARRASAPALGELSLTDRRLIVRLIRRNLIGLAMMLLAGMLKDKLSPRYDRERKKIIWSDYGSPAFGITIDQVGGPINVLLIALSKHKLDALQSSGQITAKERDSVMRDQYMGLLANQPVITGSERLMGYLAGETKVDGKFVGQLLASSVVPGAVRATARQLDQAETGVVIRETSGRTFGAEILNRFKEAWYPTRINLPRSKAGVVYPQLTQKEQEEFRRLAYTPSEIEFDSDGRIPMEISEKVIPTIRQITTNYIKGVIASGEYKALPEQAKGGDDRKNALRNAIMAGQRTAIASYVLGLSAKAMTYLTQLRVGLPSNLYLKDKGETEATFTRRKEAARNLLEKSFVDAVQSGAFNALPAKGKSKLVSDLVAKALQTVQAPTRAETKAAVAIGRLAPDYIQRKQVEGGALFKLLNPGSN